jgi:menaquinone-dependent protoporphyrinogen IX oxidase
VKNLVLRFFVRILQTYERRILVPSNKTLIAYATKSGVTEENANIIAEVLRKNHGFEVDVVNLVRERVPELDPYDHVFIGSGIRMGMWYRKASRFLKQDFTGKNVVIFLSACSAGNLKSYDDAIKKYIKNVLERYPYVEPIGYEAFGGRMESFNKVVSDTRNPEKVRLWAEEIGKKLTEK